MSRSKWKHLILINDTSKKGDNILVNRNWLITPKDINKNIIIENGKLESKPIKITVNHINKKCGELFSTKIPAVYKRQNKNKKK